MNVKILDLAIVFALCAAPYIVAAGIDSKMDTDQHGNNPRVASATLDLLTYVYLLSPDLYDGYTEMATSPLVECIQGAILACGAGEVCWVCVVNHEVCQFQCRAFDGSCSPAPPCGPTPVPDVEG